MYERKKPRDTKTNHSAVVKVEVVVRGVDLGDACGKEETGHGTGDICGFTGRSIC